MKNSQTSAFGKHQRNQRRNRDIVTLYIDGESPTAIANVHDMTPSAVWVVLRQWRLAGAPPPDPEENEKVLALIEETIPQLHAITTQLAKIGGVLKRQQLREQKGYS